MPGNSLPNDLIEVDDSIFNEFSATPPEGQMRGVGDGLPIWIDIPVVEESPEQSWRVPELYAMNLYSAQIECLFLISLLTMLH
ncbi:hypothetical protein ACVZJ6_03390 [Citrobacter portucalensis]